MNNSNVLSTAAIKACMQIYAEHIDFIRDFYDDVNDSEKYEALVELTEHRIQNLPDSKSSQIRNFQSEVVSPLIYNGDEIFKEARVYETIVDNGIVVDTEEDFIEMMKIIFKIKFEVEEKIDDFFLQLIQNEIISPNACQEPNVLFRKEVK